MNSDTSQQLRPVIFTAFLESVRWQIAAITHGLGYSDVRDLSRDDLVALTPEAAAITGLPYEPWHGDQLPLAQNI